jgi:hypothetical protein
MVGYFAWGCFSSFCLRGRKAAICSIRTARRRRAADNARLFDDFDIEAVPVNMTDGKNLS